MYVAAVWVLMGGTEMIHKCFFLIKIVVCIVWPVWGTDMGGGGVH